jgi:hypothetical protein
MNTLKKLPKNKDITYFNLETMEKECTYNQCYQKFVQINEWDVKCLDGKKPIKFKTFFHECPDCGRREKSSVDKQMSKQKYESAIFGEDSVNPPELTPSEELKVKKFMEKKSEYGQYVYGSLKPTITDSQYNKRLKK